MYEALTQPDRNPARAGLIPLEDECRPAVVESKEPSLVVWSSVWKRRPDARIRYELPQERDGHGTDLRWTLLVEKPAPDASMPGHMRKRINELINATLRYALGQ